MSVWEKFRKTVGCAAQETVVGEKRNETGKQVATTSTWTLIIPGNIGKRCRTDASEPRHLRAREVGVKH